MTDKTAAKARRGLLQAGLATVAGVAAMGLGAHDAAAQQKLAKAMIQYQETPKDGQRCDACTHWQPPAGCAIVEGQIAAAGWCGAYAPKA